MRSKILGFLTFFVVVWGIALAQSMPAQQSPRDPVRIVGLTGAQLRFTLGSVSSSVNLTNDLSGCTAGTYDGSDPKSRPSPTPLNPRVLDQVQKNARWYVVLQLSQQGNCNVQGMCGASTTINVVWLELNAQLALLRKQSVAVEHCVTETVLTDWAGRVRNAVRDGQTPSFELRNGLLLLSYQQNDYTKKVTTISSLRYDRRAPERGLVVSSKVFPLK
jgi:hypothetical protein